jgi:hypothetical protein
MRGTFLVLLVVVLAGPVFAAPPSRTDCLLSAQKPMVSAQLFFGRDIAGRAPLSDTEWSDFAEHVIAMQFSGGFTVSNGEGDWRDPRTNKTIHEKTKIVEIAVAPSPDLPRRLDAVMKTYRIRFHQQSVGLVTSIVCGAF